MGKEKTQKKKSLTDLLWVVGTTIGATALSVVFDLHEATVHLLKRYEFWEIDEITMFGLPTLACGLVWYAWRRWNESSLSRKEVEYEIAQHKRTSDALKETEEQARPTFEQAAVGISHVGTDGKWLRVNQKLCDIVGYTSQELMERTFQDITYPRDLEADLEYVRRMLAGEIQTYSTEKRYIHKDGSLVWINLTVSLVLDPSGNPKYFISVIEDINKRKQLEQQLDKYHNELEQLVEKRTADLKKSERQKNLILDSMSESLSYIDRDLKILWANRAAGELAGMGSEDLKGKDCFEIWHQRNVKCESCPVEEIFKTGRAHETELISSEGKVWYVQGYPVRDESSNIVGAIELVQDITERKKAEEKIKQVHERLKMSFEKTIGALALSLEKRDEYTTGHQQRVTDLACAIANEINLPDDLIYGIRMGGIIHDVGKVYVPAQFLTKPGKLTENEFNVIKDHVQNGYEILKKIEFPWPVAEIVLQHHENWDGSGYPQGLSGEEIILEARIMRVADTIEAMSTNRPYRIVPGLEKALNTIKEGKGKQYDPQVVDACLKVFEGGYEFKKL